MAFTDQIAKAMGISMETVNTISKEIGVRGIRYGDGSYKIEDKDVPQLKLAIQIAEKDKGFLEDVPKLKVAVQIVVKDKGFLEDVPKLKLAVLKWQKEEVQKYIDEFGVDSQHTKNIAKEHKMEELLDKQKKGDPLKLKIEELEKENKKLTSENQSLKSENVELQAKLDLIEKEKQKTAEIVARIGEKFFK